MPKNTTLFSKTSGAQLRSCARLVGSNSAMCRRLVRCRSSANVQNQKKQDSPDPIVLMDLPSKAGVPVLGIFGYLWENHLDLLELHEELGPTFAANLGLPLGGWHLATCDPELARDVLNSSDDRFYSSWPDPVARLIFPRERAFTDAEGKPWRRVLSSVLSPEATMSLQLPLMVQDITSQLRAIASSGEENFGFRDGLPGTPFYKSVQSRKAIEEILYTKIKPAIDDPEKFAGQRSVILRMCEAAGDEQEAGQEAKTNEEIAKMLAQDAFFLMFAGTDTASYSLMKCALALAKHPQWFQKLKDEQDALRAEFGGTLDRTVLSRSHVATAMALEILRLNPSLASVFRRAARDTTVGGILIPEGGRVIINLRQASLTTGGGTRDFDPAHWIKADGTSARDNSSKDNLAFSSGPRRCVGQSVATVEVITTLAIMAREIDTIAVGPEEHDINFGASPVHPTGMPMRFTPRQHAAHAVDARST